MIPEYGSKEGRYAKLLVDIDLNAPLIRGTHIRCNGESQWISFKYEQMPSFCFYCGHIGHGEQVCEAKMKDVEEDRLNEGQYGDWLRGLIGGGLVKAED